MEIIMIINLNYSSDITYNFKWFREKSTYAMYYYTDFVNNNTCDNFFFKKMKEQINKTLKRNISKGYIFFSVENFSINKIEKYLKVWKKISKSYDIKCFKELEERDFIKDGRKFFVGMATFDNDCLDIALSIQNNNMHNCYLLLALEELNSEIEVDTSCNYLLELDEQKRFSMIIKDFCKKNLIVVRMGCGGEDLEYDFVFSKNYSTIASPPSWN